MVNGPPLHLSYATGRGKPSSGQRIPCLLASPLLSPTATARKADDDSGVFVVAVSIYFFYSFLRPSWVRLPSTFAPLA